MGRGGTTGGLARYLADRVTALGAHDVDLEEALTRTFSIVGLDRAPIEEARAICAEQAGTVSTRAVRLFDAILSLSLYRPKRQVELTGFQGQGILHAS